MVVNEPLRDALRAQTRRLLNELSRKGSIPVPETETWERATNGEFRRKKSPSTDLGFLIFVSGLFEEIPQWPEYRSCCTIIADDGRLSQIVQSDTGAVFSLSTMGVAIAIGGRIYQQTRSFEYSDEQFQQLYSELERYIYRSADDFELIAPIAGLSLPHDIELRPGITLRKLTDAEIADFLEKGLLVNSASRTTMVRVNTDHCVSIAEARPRWDGVAPPLKRLMEIAEDFEMRLETVFRALVIYKAGDLQQVDSVLSSRGFFRGIPHLKAAAHHKTFRGKYVLKDEDAGGLRELYANLVRSESRSRKTSLEVALRRFVYGYERIREEDAIVDLMIAAEAIFISEQDKELSYRLRLRAARFLSQDLPERQAINKLFKDAYHVRSAAVHGGNPEIPKKADGSTQTFAEFVQAFEECLRAALQQLIKLAADGSNQRFLVDWKKVELS
jgi:Apea-like HEPN